MAFSRPPREARHVVSGHAPAAKVGEAAGEHRDHIPETPTLLGQVEQTSEPGSQRSSAEALPGGRIKGQVILGEDLPGKTKVGRYLPERDGKVGRAQRWFIGQALLDLPSDGAQLALAVGGAARHHLRGLCRNVALVLYLRVREQLAKPVIVVFSPRPRLWVKCDDKLSTLRQGFQEL